jgi:hypothetical protein
MLLAESVDPYFVLFQGFTILGLIFEILTTFCQQHAVI